MKNLSPARALSQLAAILAWAGSLSGLKAQSPAQAPKAASGPRLELETTAREQIALLHQEKLSRTPTQRKIGSQLLYILKQKHQGGIPGLKAFRPTLVPEADGRFLVDLRALVTPSLLRTIKAQGGLVVNSFAREGAIRALIPVELAEQLAQRPDVRSIKPAARAMTSGVPVLEGGDIAHRAAEARQFFSTDGAGVKIGVMSDSVDGLATAQAGGALPAVTVLPGQGGTGSGEGTAMLEIIHSLAPASSLYFATALSSEPSFAQNIRDLQAAGCKIIVDDVTYFNESPFQDGPIAQAVNDVCAAGVLFFSSAGNSGGVDRGTSGTWEGDFKDAGDSGVGQGGRLHDFGGGTYNTVLAGIGFERLDLTWSDPLGHSANDYDVYVLDNAGNVVAFSTDPQVGDSDPYEAINSLSLGQRIVIVKYAGEDRFLHLSTGRGHLTFTTQGTTYGHNASAASNAFCVAAVRVPSPPVPFVGGTANPLETFSSDGPRRMFYHSDGSPITPGDLSSTGGQVFQKPDVSAADGVYTTLPSFSPFLGTSASSPHVAAIAALLWSYNPFLTPADIRSALTGTALSIGAPGFNRNSGFGIVMAYDALAAAPKAVLQGVQLQDANQNGHLDPNECSTLVITLQNTTTHAITGVSAVLSSATAHVFVDPTVHVFPDLEPGQSATSLVPFQMSTGPDYVCGTSAAFHLLVSTATIGTLSQPFELSSQTAGFGNTNVMVSTNVPIAIPDVSTIESTINVAGIALPLSRVRVGAYITHSYDQDLQISLVAPDNTEVILSANNGQSGKNYGLDCNQMTFFSDSSQVSIAAANAPFVGEFAPERPLSAFQGKSGSAVNGTWRLRVSDQAAQDTGTLQCWTLELTPIGCLDGGGECLSPPRFVQDLSPQVVTNGDTVRFSVSVTGTSPLAYQWSFNSSPLTDETNASLVLSNVIVDASGTYQVTVSNLYGTVASAPAPLTVVMPVTILQSPTDQTATNGDTVTWTVVAEGSPPASYQWYFNLTNALPGQTNSTLVLTNVSPAQAGSYLVVISNSLAVAVTTPANLHVVVLPVIACSADTTVGLGTVWSFSPPAYADTNLVLQVLNTHTNQLCGESFSATRQWLVSDTNGYQLTCSQTVSVLQTNPPLLVCASDKSVVYGTSWNFNLPSARPAQAIEALVYDNWTNNLGQSVEPGIVEVGNQVSLAGTERYPSRFAVEYWASNNVQSGLIGAVTAQVRFYQNDGPLQGGQATPGTVLYDSGPLSIAASARGALVLDEFVLSAAVPLSGPLPANFTWTVRFSGLGNQDVVGLNLYGPAVAGQAAAGYWALENSGWTVEGTAGQAFGSQLAALSSAATLSVLNTVTNFECARSFSAIRTWQAVDACGNASTCSQTVTVLDQSAPLVVSQPVDQTVLLGRTVALSVQVSSCPPIGYQWYFNQTNVLVNETNAQLQLPNVSPSQAGTYDVVVTNTYGSVTSAVATVTIVPAPAIDTNPTDQVATNGDTVTFTVAAHGTGLLSYRWFFNGHTELVGNTGPTLSLPNLSISQAGAYQVVVSDAVGSVTSAPAHLQVLITPKLVTLSPAVAIPDVGSADSVAVVSGMNSPLARVEVGVYITHTYDADVRISIVSPDGTKVLLSGNNGQFGQNYGTDCNNLTWFSDLGTNSIVSSGAPFLGVFRPQQPLAVFIGKTGSALNGPWTLHVEDTGPQDTGTLQCWTLRLVPQGCPADGGECLTAPIIVQDISDQVVTNGANVQFSVGVQGTQPISLQWYINGTNAPQAATNTVFALTNAGFADQGTYQLVASNFYGIVTSSLAHLSVAVPAEILNNPTGVVATNGDNVALQVTAIGSAPLHYQWFFEVTNSLPGQTNSTLVLTNISLAQAGSYEVVVANSLGSITSAPAIVQVLILPRIACSADTTVGLGTVWSFSPPAYADTNLVLQVLNTHTNQLCGESFSATRQWLVSDTNGYQLTCSQTVSVLQTNPPLLVCASDKSVVYGTSWNFNLPSARPAQAIEALVYDNWTNNLGQSVEPGIVEVGNQVSLAGTERYPSRFAVEYWASNNVQSGLIGAVTAQVRFYQNDGPLQGGQATPGTVLYDSGPLSIAASARGALVLDEFVLSAAVPLSGPLPANFTWTVRFSGLGNQDVVGLNLYGPAVAGQAAAGYWALENSGWTVEGTAGQAFGSQLAALSSAATLSVLNTVTNFECARSFSAIRTWQAVDACGNASTCSQTVTVLDQSAPLVVSQPVDQTVLLGRTVALSVQVSSCPPIGYQWYFNQTNVLVNETNAQLQLPNVSPSQAGTYDVVVTNTYGSVTSAVANVVVQVPALIVGNPVDQIATNGDNVHWRVLAKGSAPLFYQWYLNITNALAGATNATLDLTNVSPADAGLYQVVVTNVFGRTTSSPARLTIVSPPFIVSGPADLTATNGDTVVWTTIAHGTPPLTYQWFFNSSVLGLETNATLAISNVIPAQAGSYQVVVANDFGSVTSAPASLQVVVVPRIACGADATVPLGSAWDFSPPTSTDTNLLIQIVSTTTNVLCGGSFNATRRWLVSDTNGFQATCTQTILVLDSAAPQMTCPANKTVLATDNWVFDVPSARESGAVETLVYSNSIVNADQLFDAGSMEIGNEINLAGANRYASGFYIAYWGTNSAQAQFAGSVKARIRFYRNDGPVADVALASPGTLFYDSGPLPITATSQGVLGLNEFQLTAAVPLAGALPNIFTWTVQFQGQGNQDAAGLYLGGPADIGQPSAGYWAFNSNTWILAQAAQSFTAQLSALDRGVNMSVVGTTTNTLCAQKSTVTRSWQALDLCSNAATCSQIVTVVNPSPPAIVAQPADRTASLNQTIQISVGVSSCPPLMYQWYFNETNALAAGTGATLVLSHLTIDQAGRYQVVIQNDFGSVTSAPAVLTISGAPVILTQPLDALVAQGGTATFTVSAEGLPAPAYQWLFNDTNVLAGQTSPSLTLTNVQPADGGFYSVIVSNSAGVVTSAKAILTLVGAPVITVQPQGVTNFQGQAVVFTVTADGIAPLSYQWMANCTRPISGANSSSLRLKSVGPIDTGTYCVIVSNALGTVLSQPATLRVIVTPRLVSLDNSQSGATLSFTTISNLLYSVYFLDTLTGTNWTLLPNTFQQPGTGSPMTVQDPTAHGATRFYRLKVE